MYRKILRPQRLEQSSIGLPNCLTSKRPKQVMYSSGGTSSSLEGDCRDNCSLAEPVNGSCGDWCSISSPEVVGSSFSRATNCVCCSASASTKRLLAKRSACCACM